MARIRTRPTLLVATLAAVMVIAVAAGTSGAQTSLSSKLKKLTKKVNALQNKVILLEQAQNFRSLRRGRRAAT